MNERQTKLLAMSKYYEVLAAAEANSPQTSARAAELARELFPPMAKPLVWVEKSYEWISGDYYVSKPRKDANYDGMWLGKYESVAEAKAACEAHHQARFLE